MQHSEQLGELAAALVKVQAVLEGAKKTSANPFFKSKYADLAAVWEACRKPLTDNGLSVIQTGGMEGGAEAVTVTTMLLHISGQYIKDTLVLKPKAASPQDVGSAITYARRYALAAIVGVSPEDDDGEAAQGRGGKGTNAAALTAKFGQQPSTPTVGNIVTPPRS